MQFSVSQQLNETDRQALFTGLKAYNVQYINSARHHPLNVMIHDEGVLLGGLIASCKANWLDIHYL